MPGRPRRSRARASLVAVLLIVASSAAGCAGDRATASDRTVYDADGEGVIDSVAEQDDVIYYIRSSYPGEDDDPSTLWKTAEGPKSTVVGTVPIAGACERPTLRSLRSLTSGHLAAMADCSEAGHYFVDINIQGVRPMAKIIFTVPSRFYDVSWSPGSDRGWITYNSDDCAAIGTVTARGLGPFEKFIPADGFKWRLDADLNATSATDCTDHGEAGFVATDPSSHYLYFMASKDAQNEGMNTKSRYNADWSVYALSIESRTLMNIASGFSHVEDVDVSSDGTKYLVAGRHNGKHGLWLASLDAPQVKKLAEGNFTTSRFVPGGILALEYGAQLNTSLIRISI